MPAFLRFIDEKGNEIETHQLSDKKACRKWCRARNMTVKDAQNVPDGYIFTLKEGQVVPIEPERRRRQTSPRSPGMPANIRYHRPLAAKLTMRETNLQAVLDSGEWVLVTKPAKEMQVGELVHFDFTGDPGVGKWFEIKNFYETVSNSRRGMHVTIPHNPLTFFLEMNSPYSFLTPSQEGQQAQSSSPT